MGREKKGQLDESRSQSQPRHKSQGIMPCGVFQIQRQWGPRRSFEIQDVLQLLGDTKCTKLPCPSAALIESVFWAACSRARGWMMPGSMRISVSLALSPGPEARKARKEQRSPSPRLLDAVIGLGSCRWPSPDNGGGVGVEFPRLWQDFF